MRDKRVGLVPEGLNPELWRRCLRIARGAGPDYRPECSTTNCGARSVWNVRSKNLGRSKHAASRNFCEPCAARLAPELQPVGVLS